MSNDIDFEQFIKLLDGALASDNENVKQALRKFLFVAAMVMGDDTEPGPFTKMMETMDDLQRRLATLEAPSQSFTDATWTSPNTTSSPTWIYGGGTSTTAGGSTTFTNAVSNTTTSSTTGNVTFSTPSNPSGYSISGLGNSTTTYDWYNVADPKTGTAVKDEIKESLKKLATSA